MTEAHLTSYQPGAGPEDTELGEISQPGGQLFQIRSAFNSGRNLSGNKPPLCADFVAKVVFHR
jgi:hypothetical protein